MRFAAVKSSNLMAAPQGVSNLIRPGEPGAAKNENAKRFYGLVGEQDCRSCGQCKCASSCSRKFDKFTTRRFHVAVLTFLVIPSEVEESLAVIVRNQRCLDFARHD